MTNLQTAVEAKIERAKEQTMSEHEAIERETVRLLVEALKKAHTEAVTMSFGSTKHREDCPVCALIRKHDK